MSDTPTQDLSLSLESATALLFIVNQYRESYPDVKADITKALTQPDNEPEGLRELSEVLTLAYQDSEEIMEDLKEIILFLTEEEENPPKIIIPDHLS